MGNTYAALMVASAVTLLSFPACAGGARLAVDEAVFDVGWERVKAVFSCNTTKNIYSLPPAECEPLSSYTNGLMRNESRYPRGVEDCAIIGGLALSMLVDRFEVTGDVKLAEEARWVAEGLRNLVFCHGYPGYVSRGLNPKDGRSIAALSSRDQVTHLVHGLWRYAKSKLAESSGRTLAKTSVVAVGEWMARTVTPENGWNFGQADGLPDPHGVCKMRKTWPHEAARLAAVYAAAWDLTREGRWRVFMDKTMAEAIAETEKLANVDPERLRSRVPDYALLQMATSLEVLRDVVSDDAVRHRIDLMMLVAARQVMLRETENDPYLPWLCGAGERPLVLLMTPGFDFPVAARQKLFAAIAEVPFSHAGSTRIVELSAAYWRCRANCLP